MKYLLTILLLVAGRAEQKTDQIDPQLSSINWTGHAQAGGYSPVGTLKIKSGTITFSNDQLSAGKVIVDMTTLQQEKDEMQTHLRGTDFFDVAKYPEAIFVLTAVKGNIATGTLTIKGVKKPISFPFRLDGKTLEASLTIDRTIYGIKYNSSSYFQDLGNYAIKNEFELKIILKWA